MHPLSCSLGPVADLLKIVKPARLQDPCPEGASSVGGYILRQQCHLP